MNTSLKNDLCELAKLSLKGFVLQNVHNILGLANLGSEFNFRIYQKTMPILKAIDDYSPSGLTFSDTFMDDVVADIPTKITINGIPFSTHIANMSSDTLSEAFDAVLSKYRIVLPQEILSETPLKVLNLVFDELVYSLDNEQYQIVAKQHAAELISLILSQVDASLNPDELHAADPTIVKICALILLGQYDDFEEIVYTLVDHKTAQASGMDV